MKRLLITMAIIVSVSVFASGQALEKLKIGEIKNGKFQVTNPDALKAFFMNSLGKSGTLGKDFQVSNSPAGDRFFVFYPVSGNKDKVSSIGVMLVKIKNDAYIVENLPETPLTSPGGGGSLEILCIGIDCNSCVPNIQWVSGYWLPVVYCECIPSGSGICNMTSKLVIHVEI